MSDNFYVRFCQRIERERKRERDREEKIENSFLALLT